ncbi:hypothetical protein IAG41_04300 [Sphingomonas sp. JC676]|uniref:squalene/phytoene synthase family protein n=1 Tax=Sphingomonas sp. JC676 TaxID=2768065 RepID=UPI001657EA76|nr:squalene/phytoene synthase family protein [Sphingomonas sp. JC676]MBC9031606.1 hypothetical protein [Sphingomonas sp. JC676]
MTEEQDPERALILVYAPAEGRAALAALLALDDALAALLRSTTQPAVGQLRLAWWREALARLDTQPPPAEQVLQGLAANLLPLGISGASLVPIVHGWEVLIEEDALGEDALRRFGEGRGSLFEAAGRTLGAGPGDPLVEAGRGWALADLAHNLDTAEEAAGARALAAPLLEAATSRKWSRNGRALGALAHRARLDLALEHGAPAPVGAPRRVMRLFWHRITGR